MGKIPQGILGGVSGKVGGIVGSSWKGINVIKTKPLSVANPRTAGQVAQRTRFANVVSFAGIILATVIKPLWDRFASRQSGYNEFVSTNIELFDGETPSIFADLIISKGKMVATAISSMSVPVGAAAVTINWTDDSGEGFKLATDDVYIVLIHEGTKEIKGFAPNVTRVDATAVVELSANFGSDETVHAYLAFRRADGTIVSNTAHKVESAA